jgi:membrane protein
MFKTLTQGLPRALPWIRSRVRPLDRVLTVHERVNAVGGGAYSSALALAGLLSLFPLVLVGIAVVGFFSASDVDLAADTVERLGLDGQAADTLLDAFAAAERTRGTVTVIGFVGLLWSGLAVVDAMSAMVNTVWQVTGRGLVGKLHELAWVAGAGSLFLVSTAAASLARVLPGPAAVPTALLGAVIDGLLVFWTFRALTNIGVHWRAHVPGAIVGAIGFGALKLLAGFYVARLVTTSSTLYGSIGVVFALLAWFVLGAKLLMYAAAYNVVRYERGHGTVQVPIEVPHIEGERPVEVTRGGAVAESTPDPAAPDPAAPGAEADGDDEPEPVVPVVPVETAPVVPAGPDPEVVAGDPDPEVPGASLDLTRSDDLDDPSDPVDPVDPDGSPPDRAATAG